MPVVLDRPPAHDAVDSPPEPEPQLQRHWWRYLFPWVKTAVGAPTEDDDLVVVNVTDEAWVLSLGYRALGIVSAYEQRVIAVVRTGLFCARQVDAPVGTGYLTLSLTPAIHAVQIDCTVLQGKTLYGLRVIERPHALPRMERAATP